MRPLPPELRVDIRRLPTLSNGLRVVVIPDAKANRVRVTLRVLVGAIADPKGRAGMAHFVEHLTFALPIGDEQRPLSHDLDAVASTYNADTQFEDTSYTSTAEARRLPELLRLESLRLAGDCDAWTDEAFAREREIVRNEVRQYNGSQQLFAAIFAGLYPELHPYRANIRGDDESLGRMTRAEACAFFRAHYAPNNAVLLISGNVTAAAVAAALPATLGRVPAHAVAARARIPLPVVRRPNAITVPGLKPTVVMAWPLPQNARQRARLRAAAAMLVILGGSRIEGELFIKEYGGPAARVLALLIEPRAGQPLDAAIDEVEAARTFFIENTSADYLRYVRMRTIHKQFERLEDVAERDDFVLEHVVAGTDPAHALRTEFDAVVELADDQVRWLLSSHLLSSTAAIAKLHSGTDVQAPELDDPAPEARPTSTGVSAPPTHPPDEPRIAADPAAARAAADRTRAPDPFAGARERTLRNGMTVILLPLSAVPTVDARIVFRTGRGDEPPGQHGVAYLAARVLEARSSDRERIRDFYLAGAEYQVQVGLDHTSFIARGFEGHIDLLLSMLARQVRDGVYPSDYDDLALFRLARSMFGVAGRGRWYEALYGENHPYARALTWRRGAAKHIERSALFEHRAAHFHPSRATLIVAGGFDVERAERWIDRAFGDWSGPGPQPRPARLAVPRAIALAQEMPGSLVKVEIALPVVGDPIACMIAAQMIDSAVGDVRAQLGVSYGVDAALDAGRRSRSIRVAGFVAADRAADAMALIRGRIRGLAVDDATSARRFVAARRKVMARFLAAGTGARELAEFAEAALHHGSFASFASAAETARTLTLSALAPALRSIDLDRAAILMIGPRAAVSDAFSAVDRTPEFIETTDDR